MSPYAPPLHQPTGADLSVNAAHQTVTRRISNGYIVVLLSLPVFIVSLFLPVLKFQVFGTVKIEGFTALIMSFPMALEKPLSIMPVLALGNVLFVLAPFVTRSRKRGLLTIAALLAWGVTAAALSLAVFPEKDTDHWLAGYYVWVAAFGLSALGTTWTALERPRERTLEEALNLA